MDFILFLTNLNAKIKNDNHSFTFKIKFGVYTDIDGVFFFSLNRLILFIGQNRYIRKGEKV